MPLSPMLESTGWKKEIFFLESSSPASLIRRSSITDKILIVVSSIKREEILQFLKNYNTDCIFDIRDTINLIDIRVDPVRR